VKPSALAVGQDPDPPYAIAMLRPDTGSVMPVSLPEESYFACGVGFFADHEDEG